MWCETNLRFGAKRPIYLFIYFIYLFFIIILRSGAKRPGAETTTGRNDWQQWKKKLLEKRVMK